MSAIDFFILVVQGLACLAARSAMAPLKRRSALAELRRDYPGFIELARIFGKASSERPLSDAASIRRWVTVSHDAWEAAYIDPRLGRLVKEVMGG